MGLYTLGRIYDEGLGVEPDPVQAHFYYNVAAANGHPQAAPARARIEQALTPDQIREAQAKARAWSPESPSEN